MPDTQPRWNVGGKANGVLLSVVGTLILVIGGLALRMIQANEGKIESNVGRIEDKIESNVERITEVEKVVPVLQEQYKGIVKQLTRIEGKIDGR